MREAKIAPEIRTPDIVTVDITSRMAAGIAISAANSQLISDNTRSGPRVARDTEDFLMD